MKYRGFICTGIAILLITAMVGCSYFTSDQKLSLLKTGICLNNAMLVPSALCVQADQKKPDKVALAACLATAQADANVACAGQLGTEFASLPTPAASPAVVAK